MRNSQNTTPVFVDVPPDWRAGFTLEAIHASAVFQARNGKEQRTRGRPFPRYRMTYRNSGLNRAEWEARFVRLRAEMQSVCVVPLWTEGLDAWKTKDASYLRANNPGDILRANGTGGRIVAGYYTYETTTDIRDELFFTNAWVLMTDDSGNRQFRRLAATKKADKP